MDQSDTIPTDTAGESEMDGELSPEELAEDRDNAAFLENLLHRYIGDAGGEDHENAEEDEDDNEGTWCKYFPKK